MRNVTVWIWLLFVAAPGWAVDCAALKFRGQDTQPVPWMYAAMTFGCFYGPPARHHMVIFRH